MFDQFKTANYWFQEKSQGYSLRKTQLKLKAVFQVNYSLYSEFIKRISVLVLYSSDNSQNSELTLQFSLLIDIVSVRFRTLPQPIPQGVGFNLQTSQTYQHEDPLQHMGQHKILVQLQPHLAHVQRPPSSTSLDHQPIGIQTQRSPTHFQFC